MLVNFSGLAAFCLFTGFLMVTAVKPAGVLAAENSGGTEAAIYDVISLKEGRLQLEGKPFAEISFNKFDLFWQLWDEARMGRELDDNNYKYVRQAKALKDLRDMGFRTIRIFAHPWAGVGFREVFDDESLREDIYFRAMDAVLDLCDRYGMKLVFCLGCSDFTDKTFDAAKGGFVFGEEHLRDLVANPESKSRRRLYEYLDTVISRYRGRKSIAMWEITNELTLDADIQPGNRIHDGQRMPTLKDVARFYNDVTDHIKKLDGLRLVNNGGSNLREYAWNLYSNKGWTRDTVDEHAKAFNLVWGNSSMDFIDIHYYSGALRGLEMRSAAKVKPRIDLKWYMETAGKLGKPLMIGEYGLLPVSKGDTAFWKAVPDYFDSWDDPSAKVWVQRAMDDILEADVPLSYWWCYQSDREMDDGKPDRMDIELDRNPELVRIIADANHKLKAKLGTD